MVAPDDLVKVGLQVIVVRGLHGINSHSGVVVLGTALAAGEEAGFKRVAQGVVVLDVKVLGHEHVRLRDGIQGSGDGVREIGEPEMPVDRLYRHILLYTGTKGALFSTKRTSLHKLIKGPSQPPTIRLSTHICSPSSLNLGEYLRARVQPRDHGFNPGKPLLNGVGRRALCLLLRCLENDKRNSQKSHNLGVTEVTTGSGFSRLCGNAPGATGGLTNGASGKTREHFDFLFWDH